MNLKASFRSVEAAMTWFRQAKKPYWSLFTGFSKEAKDLAMKNSEITDMDDSANLLEERLTDKVSGGGRVTIYITDTKNSSHGYTEYLEIAASNAAISGTGNNQPFFGIGGIQDYIDGKIAMAEKDRTIKDLQDALEEKQQGTGINKIWNRVLEEAPIQEIIMALAAKFLGPAAFTPAINGPRITDDAAKESEEEAFSDEDQNKINDALQRISVIFPNLPDVLQKLAAWIEENPDMAKGFLKSKKK
jgi:hypothetical protein